MSDRIISICNRGIEYLFYALFFFVPLIFLPVNYELFEFNKMMLTYAITVLIVGFWAIKTVLQGEIRIQRTPLDIPILLFLTSQIISTFISIDVHTSIWGYYSRFNGGLASIICYVMLYYAFVSNISAAIVKRLLMVALASGAIVAIFGVLEHFGIDKDYWVQDVQNRVFSTLGQPNWLAAYLSVLIPIAIAFGISNVILRPKAEESHSHHEKPMRSFASLRMTMKSITFILLASLFYLSLLYTKSRSGFLGLGIGLLFFAIAFLWMKRKFILNSKFLILNFIIIGIITFIIGTPFEQLNKFTLEGIRSQLQTSDSKLQTSTKPQGPALEVGGGTESGEIRKIVWKGAIDIAKANPIFGTGVETFAYSYYQFRPIEHNKTSEWDFLYNKAHNEYLNYLANTGLFGLGSYLLIIGWFLFVTLGHLKTQILKLKTTTQNSNLQKEKFSDLHFSFELCTLSFALLAGYISILVSNFFGFSVVIINLFFFLIPAFALVLNGQLNPDRSFAFPLGLLNKSLRIMNYELRIMNLLIVVIILTSYFSLLTLYNMWDADRNFAKAKSFYREGEHGEAYFQLAEAVSKRGGEPLFHDEMSINAAALSVAALQQNESTISAQFVKEAINRSDFAIDKGPNNPNFWRTRIRVFYTLSQIDESYTKEAIAAAKRATQLSPTDPKIGYNYGLILGQDGQIEQALKELERTIQLKPDYRDPVYALGLFYHEAATDNSGKVTSQELLGKAIKQMEDALKIASEDSQAQEKLKNWRGF